MGAKPENLDILMSNLNCMKAKVGGRSQWRRT